VNISASIGSFFKNKVALVTLTMVALSAWLFARVSQINPTILGDEWVYVVSSRLDSPWASAPTFDLGNYLFNFVYSSTNICGEAFYTCSKALNLVFFAAFALLLFAVAVRLMPFWAALVVLVAIYLSPLSIYVSMYLPETMYFSLLALAFWLIVRVIETQNSKNWMLVGAALGLAALAKPHALFSVAAFGIFLIIWELSRGSKFSELVRSAVYFAGAFLVARVVIGLMVGGTKTINILGAYGASGAVGEFVTGAASASVADGGSIVGAGPVAGAVALFLPQMATHYLLVTALVGAAMALILLAAIESVRKSSKTPQSSLAVLMVVWIGVLLIVVALFTGWVTGSGDDHTTRLLLRYYEFLIPIAAIPALAFLFDKEGFRESKAWARITASAIVFAGLSAVFTDFFFTRTVQIADAPSAAGLIGNAEIWNLVGVVAGIGVLVLAFFPPVAPYVITATLAVSMIGTGWATQEQYLFARGDTEAADLAGKFARNYVPFDELAGLTVLTNSRFDGRLASLWMESNNPMQILERGAVVDPSDLEPETKWVLALGLTALGDYSGSKISGPGYTLYEIKDEFDFSLYDSMAGSALESTEGFNIFMYGLAWMDSNEASISLSKKLPANAKLLIELSALPGIYGQEVAMTLGDSTLTLLIQDSYNINALEFQFQNTSPADEIVISIPKVMSNLEAGVGENDRRIGLGIGQIALVD
jgi:hypothetical protein